MRPVQKTLKRPRKLELPSAATLHEMFAYDPLTGSLKWKERPRHHFKCDRAWKACNKMYVGKEAGMKTKTGIYVGMWPRTWAAHRIAWVMSGRELPPNTMHIDHINGNQYDNRLDNLRTSTPSQNNCNARINSANTSGYKGVHYCSRDGRWRVLIYKDRKKTHLGMFDDPEKAAIAYNMAALELHGSYARLNHLNTFSHV